MQLFSLKIFTTLIRVGLLCSSLSLTHAYADALPEYSVKAAFLYNFATFAEWPEKPIETFNLCILGKDLFVNSLDVIDGKMVGDAKLVTRHLVGTGGILRGCQMLYIASSESDSLPEILDLVRTSSILTVTELPGAAMRGVMIELKTDEKNKITFEINLSILRQSRLDLSSKLLRLAQKVY